MASHALHSIEQVIETDKGKPQDCGGDYIKIMKFL